MKYGSLIIFAGVLECRLKSTVMIAAHVFVDDTVGSTVGHDDHFIRHKNHIADGQHWSMLCGGW